MVRGELNPYSQTAIQLLVNYWELRPSAMGTCLNELLRLGISHVSTFVPWQAVESDISHTLSRFLQAAAERKMTVSLILTPEVGVHYMNSGIPRDVLGKPESLAKSAAGGLIHLNLPPNAFALPSLSSPEFSKRYHNFLTRMDNLLNDLSRTQPHVVENVTAVVTGSFWKYYRAPQFSSRRSFAGPAGDFSGSVSVEYRQRLEQFYSQEEFSDSEGEGSKRWKAHRMEENNRRWFFQQSELVFRHRSQMFLSKKASGTPVAQVEVFTPEADPGYAYSNFLQAFSGGHGDFSRLSFLLDEAASRAGFFSGNPVPSFVHWSGLGGFGALSDSEKQFLILKTILLLGGRGGGIMMDHKEWFALSAGFRKRADSISRWISRGELKLKNQVLYLTSHLWSDVGILGRETLRQLGGGVRVISSVDAVVQDREASLVIVDPSFIVNREAVKKLTKWATHGRVVVMPRSPVYTQSAQFELEEVLASSPTIDMELGLFYRLHNLPRPENETEEERLDRGTVPCGKLIVFDLPADHENSVANAIQEESVSAAWRTFLTSVLSVAEVQTYCKLSNPRLKVIPLEKKDGNLGLFVMNGSARPEMADLLFSKDVTVGDLTSSFTSSEQAGSMIPARKFALEVPPCGVLPIAATFPKRRKEEQRESSAVGIVPENEMHVQRDQGWS